MDLNDYQQKAHNTSLKTSVKGDKILYPVLGLCGESGEIAEKFKKMYRDKNGEVDDVFKTEVIKELGDVMWYIAELCTVLNVELSTVAEKNIEKLYSRKDRGQLHGNGDNR